MGFAVVITPQAQEDLRGIVLSIRQDSPRRALAFGNALIDQALALGAFPTSGSVVLELGDPAVRKSVRGDYHIIDEMVREPTILYVLRFWHDARGKPKPGLNL